MEFSAQQIADLLEGRVEGNPEQTVNNLSKIEDGSSGSLSFLANPKYASFIYTTQASIVIVGDDFVAEEEIKTTLIRVEQPYQAFAKLLEMYNQLKHNKSGIDVESKISESAKIGENCYIGAFTYIGDHVKIGDNCKIYPGSYIGDNTVIGDNALFFSSTKVYSDCVLGKNITLHSGVVIGGDGFGFAPNNAGYDKVAQIGNVIIEDHVEIGANTTVDRATLGSTIIRKGVKLDNLIQIAHNVEIGENTVIAAQTGIAGSTKLGANCMIGGQVGIVGHLNIGNNVKIAAQSGVSSHVKDDAIIQGSPAFAIGDYKKAYVYFRKLARMADDIDKLKKQVQSN